MKKYFLVFTLSLLSFYCSSQEKDVEIITSILDDSNSGKKLPAVTMSIYSDGQLESSIKSNNKGKFPKFRVSTGKYYQVYIRKAGYVSKMIELDARIDSVENAPNLLFLKFETGLFKIGNGIDSLALEKMPIVKFYFDSNYFYAYDLEYTQSVLAKIEALKKANNE